MVIRPGVVCSFTLQPAASEEIQDEGGMSSKVFLSDICAPLSSLMTWRSFMVSKFGALASSSRAFQSVLASLQTKSGLAKVKACSQTKTPLHGTSGSNVGISVCSLVSNGDARVTHKC